MTSGLELYNTLKGAKEPFLTLGERNAKAGKAVSPKALKQVKLYVCGPTVYDDAHLGHARCYITWDVLYRFLKFLGYEVTYVRNITDVDDKILNRAKERGESPATLAERNYQSFQDDMAKLNVLPPDQEPRATEHIQSMQDGIQALIAKGAAYVTPDGSVYFRVESKADYGKLKYGTSDPALLKKHLDDLKSGARVEVDVEKESPLDFALWKAVPADDPNGWPSPWPPTDGAPSKDGAGWGRPGWHMECSAMNHAVFGEQIDIHAGGADLIFPHHENEIAQSEAWTGKQPFAQYWLHNGFVNVSGEKMSKSLGNFSTIKTLLARYDANTIRYFLLTNHYRMPVDFNDEALQAAENRMIKIRRAFKDALQKFKLPPEALASQLQTEYADTDVVGTWNYFQDALRQDLNTAKALSAFDEAVVGMNASQEARAQEYFRVAVNIAFHLGFNLTAFQEMSVALPVDEIRTIYKEMTGAWQEADQPTEVLLSKIVDMRKQAKLIKNWTQADAIRKHLTDIGLQILDNKDGTTTLEKDGVEIVRV